MNIFIAFVFMNVNCTFLEHELILRHMVIFFSRWHQDNALIWMELEYYIIVNGNQLQRKSRKYFLFRIFYFIILF